MADLFGPDKPENKILITVDPSAGRLSVMHTERSMNCYNVTEPELETMGVLNSVATISFSIAAAVMGFCIDFKKDALFAEKLPPDAVVVDVAVNWLGFPVVVLALLAGGWAILRKGSIVTRIKKESRNLGGQTDGK